MISIIDYGLGNVKAFSNIFKMLNVKHEITANFDAIKIFKTNTAWSWII